MFSSHMKPVVDIMTSVVDGVCRYNQYLQEQNARVSDNHVDEEETEDIYAG